MKIFNKGSVLIISLIIMSIATSLSLFIIKITKDITLSSRMILDKLDAKIRAENEVERLKYLFSTGNFKNYYFEPFSLKKIYSSRIILNGKTYKLNEYLDISVTDMSSKLNLYLTSTEEELINFFKSILGKKKASILTSAYLDWIDKDSLQRIGGAETSYYRNILKAKYGARNNNFLQDIEELLNIKGFSVNDFKTIKKYASFIYTAGIPNIYLADPKILNEFRFINKSTLKTIINLKKTGRLKELYKFISSKYELAEILSTEPSKVLEITVTAYAGEAVEKIYCIIDFKETENYPFVVYKYKQ